MARSFFRSIGKSTTLICHPTKPTKYHSKRCRYNGIWYDSQDEARHAALLDLLRRSTEASQRVVKVQRQISFNLSAGIVYRADFVVDFADGHTEYHEVKGFETPQYKLKMKLFKEKYPDINLKIIR